MDTKQTITLARKHVDNGAIMASSALICLSDAVTQYDDGNYDTARMWAVKSLGYSVGVFHSDYKRAA